MYKEIAERLGITHETVKKHLKNIYQKLHVQNKIEALNKYRLL
jgi:DNA-binding CsgD family transcriptional regulator